MDLSIENKAIAALPAEGIRVGSAGMLSSFLELCGAFQTGRFFFTAPFFDESFVNSFASKLSVSRCDCEVVVKTPEAAREMLAYLRSHGCRTVSASIATDLHAKVFLFEVAGKCLLGLVGSHNPTAAGIKSNLEIGVYFGAQYGKPEWRTLFDLREFLRRASKPYVETVKGVGLYREKRDDNRNSVNQ
jgi:hypothetical protein